MPAGLKVFHQYIAELDYMETGQKVSPIPNPAHRYKADLSFQEGEGLQCKC